MCATIKSLFLFAIIRLAIAVGSGEAASTSYKLHDIRQNIKLKDDQINCEGGGNGRSDTANANNKQSFYQIVRVMKCFRKRKHCDTQPSTSKRIKLSNAMPHSTKPGNIPSCEKEDDNTEDPLINCICGCCLKLLSSIDEKINSENKTNFKIDFARCFEIQSANHDIYSKMHQLTQISKYSKRSCPKSAKDFDKESLEIFETLKKMVKSFPVLTSPLFLNLIFNIPRIIQVFNEYLIYAKLYGCDCRNHIAMLLFNCERINSIISENDDNKYVVELRNNSENTINIPQSIVIVYHPPYYYKICENEKSNKSQNYYSAVSLDVLCPMNKFTKSDTFTIKIGYFYKTRPNVSKDILLYLSSINLKTECLALYEYLYALVHNYTKLSRDEQREQRYLYSLIIEREILVLNGLNAIKDPLYCPIMMAMYFYNNCNNCDLISNDVLNVLKACDFGDKYEKTMFLRSLRTIYLSLDLFKDKNVVDIIRMYTIVRVCDTETFIIITEALFEKINEINNKQAKTNFKLLCENISRSVFLSDVFKYKDENALSCILSLYNHSFNIPNCKHVISYLKRNFTKNLTIKSYLTDEFIVFLDGIYQNNGSSEIQKNAIKYMSPKIKRCNDAYDIFLKIVSIVKDYDRRMAIFNDLLIQNILYYDAVTFIISQAESKEILFLNLVAMYSYQIKTQRMVLNNVNYEDIARYKSLLLTYNSNFGKNKDNEYKTEHEHIENDYKSFCCTKCGFAFYECKC